MWCGWMKCGEPPFSSKEKWMRDEIQEACTKSYSQKNDFNNKFAARNWVKAHQLFANSKLPALANSLRKRLAKARMTLEGNSPMRWTFGCIFANETTPDQQQHCCWPWICVDTWHDMTWSDMHIFVVQPHLAVCWDTLTPSHAFEQCCGATLERAVGSGRHHAWNPKSPTEL